MSSTAFHDANADYDAIEVLLDNIAASDPEAYSTAEHIALLQRAARIARRLPGLGHESINWLDEHASVAELGGSLRNVLADLLRVTRGEAGRLITEAQDLGPRRTLTGQPLPARLEATAAGQAGGAISTEQVRIIRGCLDRLPYWLDEPTRAEAERQLAAIAAQYRPEQLRSFAEDLELRFNPDGNYTDEERARRRGVTLGPQRPDGTSPISGNISAEMRAGLDAVFAKSAAPGMCNPGDEQPTVHGTADEKAVSGDARSAAQRRHDALAMMVRCTLMSGELGSHQGLPVTIVATAKLADLEAKTGMAKTATGTLLPITDVIAMSAHAYHYLLLFDNAKRCQLYKGRTTRLATPAQRLVLTATEGGCTRPGCNVPAAWCQVHHLTGWAARGATDIDNLTLSCGPDNRLADEAGWTTRKRKDGTTEWIPPPHLDTGEPRTNSYFHPERFLRGDKGDADDEGAEGDEAQSA
jgi:hypothetical protein